MANSSTQSSKKALCDRLILTLGLCFFVLGILGFAFLNHYNAYIQLLSLACGVVAGIIAILFSAPGREFIAFSKSAYIEVCKVVWPAPKEAGKMTLIVFVFALVMAVYLWMSDKIIEWLIFSLILRWK